MFDQRRQGFIFLGKNVSINILVLRIVPHFPLKTVSETILTDTSKL